MPLTFRTVIGISLMLAMYIVYVWWQDSKDKSEYFQTTGRITYLDQKLGDLPFRNPGKYRYLLVEGYQYPFEIFVGNESGDFEPMVNKIDELMTGDVVTVFYDEKNNTHAEGVNRFLKFVDKENVSYFEKGNSKSVLIVIGFGAVAFLVILSLWLWKTKRIPF